jgi:hypothetical protein
METDNGGPRFGKNPVALHLTLNTRQAASGGKSSRLTLRQRRACGSTPAHSAGATTIEPRHCLQALLFDQRGSCGRINVTDLTRAMAGDGGRKRNMRVGGPDQDGPGKSENSVATGPENISITVPAKSAGRTKTEYS